MELVTECRQSGLTDAAWCNEHGISPSCFYNAVTRLRKKSLSDTESSWKSQRS
ncbi:MAG: IS66 family insertion sequence element accessory protein TnpA [Oliverpabstia sp.]